MKYLLLVVGWVACSSALMLAEWYLPTKGAMFVALLCGAVIGGVMVNLARSHT